MSNQDGQEQITVEVALAMPERQKLLVLEVNAGSTVADAIKLSAVLELFEGFVLDPAKVGIFGRKAAMDDVLRDGDRIEIYRSLIADPKEIRRQLALEQAKS